MEKYSKLLFTLIISFVLFLTVFAFREFTAVAPESYPPPEISASQIKNSRHTPVESPQSKYLIRLEGNIIYAYRNNNGKLTELEKSEIETSSLSSEDIRILQNGIYADSAEDILLYFESYTS